MIGTKTANWGYILPEGNYRFRADLNGTQFWSGKSNHCAVPGCTEAAMLLHDNGPEQVSREINYTYDSLNRLTAAKR